jgi:hypothetical protein
MQAPWVVSHNIVSMALATPVRIRPTDHGDSLDSVGAKMDNTVPASGGHRR